MNKHSAPSLDLKSIKAERGAWTKVFILATEFVSTVVSL